LLFLGIGQKGGEGRAEGKLIPRVGNGSLLVTKKFGSPWIGKNFGEAEDKKTTIREIEIINRGGSGGRTYSKAKDSGVGRY